MSTDLQVLGVRYDLEDALTNPKLNILAYMNKRIPASIAQIRRVIGSLGDRYTAARLAREAGEAGAPTDQDVLFEILSDDDAMEAWRSLIWLVRTHSGDRGPGGAFLTVDEAADGIGYGDIEWIEDPADTAPVELEALEPISTVPGASPVRAVGKGRSKPAAVA